MPHTTLDTVFQAAIGAERAAENLFRGLQSKFAAHPGLAEFWGDYARDEQRHAAWLEGLYARIDPQRLAEPVDEHTAAMVRAVAGFSVESALAQIADLEDAFQLVNEIENAETNAIFQFLLNNFEPDEEMKVFLRAQLQKHIARLMLDFPQQYKGVVARKAVKAAW
jgi:rubrerythrin